MWQSDEEIEIFGSVRLLSRETKGVGHFDINYTVFDALWGKSGVQSTPGSRTHHDLEFGNLRFYLTDVTDGVASIKPRYENKREDIKDSLRHMFPLLGAEGYYDMLLNGADSIDLDIVDRFNFFKQSYPTVRAVNVCRDIYKQLLTHEYMLTARKNGDVTHTFMGLEIFYDKDAEGIEPRVENRSFLTKDWDRKLKKKLKRSW